MTYEVYDPTGGTTPQDPAVAAVPAVADGLGDGGPWRVAIEYSNQGQAKPPTLVQLGATTHAARDQALLAARRAAFEFDPPDPWSQQGREVFRDGPDGFLVILQGATSTFHMRVRIVAQIAAPGSVGSAASDGAVL